MADPARISRILVIEEELLIAQGIVEVLIDAGFEFIDVAGTIELALGLIENGVFSAASLDANLAGVSAIPIAAALEARGVPYVVLSAVSFAQQPLGLRHTPFLRKPCRPAALIGALTDLCMKQQ